MPDPRLVPWAVVTPRRLEHIERVAALAARWAAELGLPAAERQRWARAVWLHDALRDAEPESLRAEAGEPEWPAPLLHGPAAAARAARDGETDRELLDAVRYHSVGHPGWGLLGWMLYCADFLEPGRPFAREERAALAKRFPGDFERVFREVVEQRIDHMKRVGKSVPPPTQALWQRWRDAEGD
ncbi:MAG: HD domain-containing protein [Gemmatimonadales bacterium]